MSDIVENATNLFDRLLKEDAQKILFKAITAGAKELQTLTKQQLLIRVPNADSSMIKGVRVKKDTTYNEVKVHILGDYRLKWFEKGTKPRYTKGRFDTKKSYRGAMKGVNFFRNSRNNEAAIADAISETLTKELNKIK